MRKDSLITRSLNSSKLTILIAFLLMSATTTWAVTTDDYTPISFGEDVTIVEGENFFKFTTVNAGNIVVATSDGTTNKVPSIYIDVAHSSSLTADYYVGMMSSSANLLEYTLEASTTYYLYINSTKSVSYTFQVNQDPEIKVTGITNGMGENQEENAAINLSGNNATYYAKLTVAFNRVLDDWNTTATVTSDSTTKELTISGNTNRKYGKGNKITIDLYNTLAELMADETLKPGESFSVTISDIKAVATGTLYGNDGNLTLTFVAPDKGPTVKKSESVPEKFLSYWRTGDEDGKIVLTFNNELSTTKNTKNATITYGDNDAMGDSGSDGSDGDEEVTNYTEISIPITISGNTATIDLTGVYRSFETLLPGATITEPATVGVDFPILYDADGASIKTGISGLSRFKYSIDGIESVPSGGFTPAGGSLIDNNSRVEFGLNHNLLDSYDGFSIAYTVGEDVENTLVAASDVAINKEEDDSVTYSFILPDEVAEASTATITLSNPVWADGQTHFFSVTYGLSEKDLLPIEITPDTTSTETLTTLEVVTLTFDEPITLDENQLAVDAAPIVVYADVDNTQMATCTPTVSSQDPAVLTLTLNNPITEEGCYTLIVPKGLIGNETYFTSSHEEGRSNPELILHYTVTVRTGISSILENGNNQFDIYTLGGVQLLKNASKHNIPSLKPSLYIVNGKKIILK